MADVTARNKVERVARLHWCPIANMRVNPLAQRELNEARVDRIVADFDPEQIGTPTVNERDGHLYILDGHHRIEGMRRMGWTDQKVQCWLYTGLTEAEEAETFLKLNDVLAVNAFPRFRVGVQAGRAEECDIDRIVRAQELHVSQDKGAGSVSAVGTLRRVYRRGGPAVLARSLGMIRDAYGDAGMLAPVIDGVGLLCQRYNGVLDTDAAIQRLSTAHGGVSGLLNKAEAKRLRTGNQRGSCVAAAAVDIINMGRGGKKLPSWWADE